jgi:hypothetical protein
MKIYLAGQAAGSEPLPVPNRLLTFFYILHPEREGRGSGYPQKKLFAYIIRMNK